MIAVWSPVVALMAILTRTYRFTSDGSRQLRVVAAVALDAPVRTSVAHCSTAANEELSALSWMVNVMV